MVIVMNVVSENILKIFIEKFTPRNYCQPPVFVAVKVFKGLSIVIWS